MAENPRFETTHVEEAQRERARFREAMQAASEVLALVAGQTTAARTAQPPSIFAAVVQDHFGISIARRV